MYKKILLLGIFICTFARASVVSNNAEAVSLPSEIELTAQAEGITEYRLKNGLRIVLAPNPITQVVALNVVYLTGSREEGDGETGTAHMLEHLMFKGTSTMPAGSIVEGMSRRGIQFNGTTSHDRTRYQATLSASMDHLDWLLKMEADRMMNTVFTQGDLEQEIPVVLREMELADNDPFSMLMRRMLAVGFDWHGYGKSPLGVRGDIEKLEAAAVKNFYRQHYRPDNAVLILCGKFDPEAALKRIALHFGQLAKPPSPRSSRFTAEPERDGPRSVELVRSGNTRWLAALYPLPSAAHPDSAALWALSGILGGAPHGRLYRNLVKEGKAADVANAWLAMRDYGIMLTAVALGADHQIDPVRQALIETLEGLRVTPIAPGELERAQLLIRNAHVQMMSEPLAVADILSEGMTAGDWRLYFVNYGRLQTLSVSDVQTAGERYLRKMSRVSGDFVPSSESDVAQIPEPFDVSEAVKRYVPQQSAGQLPVAPPGVSIDELEAGIQRFSLSNGLKIALVPKATAGGRVRGLMNLRFGDERSLFGKRQIADLTAMMLMNGTRTMSRQQLTDRIASLGAEISVVPDDDRVALRFETGRESVTKLFEVISEILKEPAFPKDELDSLRTLVEAALDNQRNEPGTLASEALTGHTNPYPAGDIRRPPETNEAMAGIRAVARDDLIRFHKQFYGAEYGELVLVGDFDAQSVRKQLEAIWGGWKSPRAYVRPPIPYHAFKQATLRVATPGKSAGQYLARLPIALQDDANDAAYLMIVNRILGGTPVGSRLSQRLRGQEGMSYSVGSRVSFSAFEERGHLTVGATYPPGQGQAVSAILADEVARLVRDGITLEELRQAQQGLIQESSLIHGQDGQILNMLPLQLRTGRTMAHISRRDAAIEAATIEQVNAALRKHVNPAQLVEVLADAQAGALPPAP